PSEALRAAAMSPCFQPSWFKRHACIRRHSQLSKGLNGSVSIPHCRGPENFRGTNIMGLLAWDSLPWGGGADLCAPGGVLMAKPLVSDALWDLIRPLLPPVKPRRFRFPGRKPVVDDRKALTGIPFVLKTGIPWEDLAIEMGCGWGMTCWRRLQAWQQQGV